VIHVANDEADEVNQRKNAKNAAKRDDVKQDQHWTTAQVHTVYTRPANEKSKQNGECCIVLSVSQAFNEHAGFLTKVFDFGEEPAFFRFFLRYMTAGAGGSGAILGRASIRCSRDGKRWDAGQHKYR